MNFVVGRDRRVHPGSGSRAASSARRSGIWHPGSRPPARKVSWSGDKLVSINGERLYYIEDFSTFISLSSGKPINLVVERGGQKVALNNYQLTRKIYPEINATEPRYGITFKRDAGHGRGKAPLRGVHDAEFRPARPRFP